MSRTPSANKNLVKGNAIRKAGFKTYMHSILDENGQPYYALEATKLYNNGVGATGVIRELLKKYPNVDPPSLPAMNTFLKKYSMVMVPAAQANPHNRPDAIAAMYEGLEIMKRELTYAEEMRGESHIPLAGIRAAAMNYVQVAEKIANVEKNVGMTPVNVTLHQDNSTNVQNTTNNAMQIIATDPEKGRELLNAFTQFASEVEVLERAPANATS